MVESIVVRMRQHPEMGLQSWVDGIIDGYLARFINNILLFMRCPVMKLKDTMVEYPHLGLPVIVR